MCQGADKSLAGPGRKQARKQVRDARDFNNIEARAVIKFLFPARQGAEGNSRHSGRNISLFPSWSGYRLISTPVKDIGAWVNLQGGKRGSVVHAPLFCIHFTNAHSD